MATTTGFILRGFIEALTRLRLMPATESRTGSAINHCCNCSSVSASFFAARALPLIGLASVSKRPLLHEERKTTATAANIRLRMGWCVLMKRMN